MSEVKNGSTCCISSVEAQSQWNGQDDQHEREDSQIELRTVPELEIWSSISLHAAPASCATADWRRRAIEEAKTANTPRDRHRDTILRVVLLLFELLSNEKELFGPKEGQNWNLKVPW